MDKIIFSISRGSTQKNPTDSTFGIQPIETSRSASLVFKRLSADVKTAISSRGNWRDLKIIVNRP